MLVCLVWSSNHVHHRTVSSPRTRSRSECGAPQPWHWARLLGLKSQQCLGKEFCDVSESLRTGQEVSLDRLTPLLTVQVSWGDSTDLSLGSCPLRPPMCSFPYTALAQGRPDDSRLFLRSNLTDVIHSVVLKAHPAILSSAVYQLSPKTLDAGGQASYLLPQLPAVW